MLYSIICTVGLLVVIRTVLAPILVWGLKKADLYHWFVLSVTFPLRVKIIEPAQMNIYLSILMIDLWFRLFISWLASPFKREEL